MSSSLPEQPSDDVPPTLIDRPPGAGVIAKCLALNAAAPPRGWLARVFGHSPLAADATSWYGGALGELAVGARLQGLNGDWTVLHSVPIGKHDTDIDHVIVGPTGVFTINTKRHPGGRIWLGVHMLMINGQKTDYLRKARAEALQASRRLTAASGAPVTATPIIVLVGAKAITVKQRPADVVVLREEELVRWLQSKRRGPRVTPAPALLSIVGMPRTWHANGAAAIETFDASHNATFALLRRSVGRAAGVRAVWVFGVVVAALATSFGLLTG
ncbi:nuclease-related domain-containing protein [Agromyces hippuratus]|uniref:nuclease-related domain-containing protein n=1 Tax=Agromyces hippuratus TaxID=286438 RepID=UPI0035EB072D